MKVAQLIKELELCSPDAEVVVNNEPIYFIEELPGYYDGSFQKLIQNESKSPFYNIEGTKFTREGNKVRLNVMSFEDVIWNSFDEKDLNNIQFIFDKSLGPDKIEFYKKVVEKEIESFKKSLKEVLEKDKK